MDWADVSVEFALGRSPAGGVPAGDDAVDAVVREEAVGDALAEAVSIDRVNVGLPPGGLELRDDELSAGVGFGGHGWENRHGPAGRSYAVPAGHRFTSRFPGHRHAESWGRWDFVDFWRYSEEIFTAKKPRTPRNAGYWAAESVVIPENGTQIAARLVRQDALQPCCRGMALCTLKVRYGDRILFNGIHGSAANRGGGI